MQGLLLATPSHPYRASESQTAHLASVYMLHFALAQVCPLPRGTIHTTRRNEGRDKKDMEGRTT